MEDAKATKMQSDIDYLKRDVETLRADLRDHKSACDSSKSSLNAALKELADATARLYVTLVEFKPVKGFVYGLIALVLTSFGGSLIALVLK